MAHPGVALHCSLPWNPTAHSNDFKNMLWFNG